MFDDAAQRTPGNVRILMNIIRHIRYPFQSANICADTPTGDSNKLLLLVSHSDSVPAGPGINDNGKIFVQ
jgi:Zn-dependent M28 family amino/carboxypeptidase